MNTLKISVNNYKIPIFYYMKSLVSYIAHSTHFRISLNRAFLFAVP